MKNLTTFQLVLIGLFFVFLIVGTLIFAGILPGFRATPGGTAGELVMWGTVSGETIRPIIEQFNKDYKASYSLSYEEKSVTTFEQEFVEAKADNQAPDLLLIPQAIGLSQRARLGLFPAELVSIRNYRDTFIDAGDLWLSNNRAFALPLVVDPFVMYYNSDLLNASGLPTVPTSWSEFKAKTIALTKLDSRRNIVQSAVALGEVKNINHAKDLLTLLLFHAGNPIIINKGDSLASGLNENFDSTVKPAVLALNFYTQFADPARPNYSWNRSLPEARQAFNRGQTIFYFGYASEYKQIARENPHLAFDVALPPQSASDNELTSVSRPKLTLGRLLSVAVVGGGRKSVASASAALALAGTGPVAMLAEALALPPARRDLLGRATPDPAMTLFYRAAVLARTWADPDPTATKKIFDTMIESVVTGRERSSNAVSTADRELNAVIKRVYGNN